MPIIALSLAGAAERLYYNNNRSPFNVTVVIPKVIFSFCQRTAPICNGSKLKNNADHKGIFD